MNSKTFAAIFISLIMFFGSFATVAFSGQPPLIAGNIYLVGTIGQPARLDPAGAYDTASAEVIMNVYETLIWFDRNLSKPAEEQGDVGHFVPQLATALPTVNVVILNVQTTVAVNASHPQGSNWTDVPPGADHYKLFDWVDNSGEGSFTGVDVIYMEKYTAGHALIAGSTYAWFVLNITYGATTTMFLKRTEYIFTIETNHEIHWWLNQAGVNQTGQFLKASDVEYSLESGMINDRSGCPMWMFYLPMFDQMNAGYWTGSTAKTLEWGRLLDNALQSNDGTSTFTISLGVPFPETAWFQILSQTWGSVVPKAFAQDHGCWNGVWLNGTGYPVFSYYRRWPGPGGRSPLDSAPTTLTPYPGSAATTLYTAHPDKAPTMRGTGPYRFRYWNKVALEWRADMWLNYVGGWVGLHVDTVIVKGIPEWTTRKMAFLKGDYDAVVVPRANMFELLEWNGTAYVPLPGIICNKDLPSLASDSLHYVLHIDPASPYLPKIWGVNQPDFFNNVNTRRAFSYALNFTQYLAEAWYNEAVQPTTWHIAGLAPDYRLNTTELPPYNIDKAKIESFFKLAKYTTPGHVNESLWDSGFTIQLFYNTGNDQRRIALEMMESTIEILNGLRPGKNPFVITVVDLDWPVILGNFEEMTMPDFMIGWLADFAQQDNWVRPYMNTYGDFSYFQGYSNATVDMEMTLALKTDNETLRRELYEDLQRTFITDNPTLMIAQALGRAWRRDWVQGWYYNALYPGTPFYERWKTLASTVEAVNLDVSSTMTQSNPVVDMVRDNPLLTDDFEIDVNVTRTDNNPDVVTLRAYVVVRRIGVWSNNTRRTGTVLTEVGEEDVIILLAGQTGTAEIYWEETLVPWGFYNMSTEVAPLSTGTQTVYDTTAADDKTTGGQTQVLPPGDTTGYTSRGSTLWVVDISDLVNVISAMPSSPGNIKWNPLADLDRSGVVAIEDLVSVISWITYSVGHPDAYILP